MSANEKFRAYTEQTDIVAVYPDAGTSSHTEMAYLALGLAGETGECVDVIKKIFRDGAHNDQNLHELRRQKVLGEMGDIMWYYCRLLRYFGLEIDDVLDMNINKLMERKAKDELKVHEET